MRRNMRGKIKQRLALWVVVTLLIGLLPVQNGTVSKAADTSNAEAQKTVRTDYGLQNPRTDENGDVTWDCIYFGNYWQEDTNKDGTADKNDGKTPIKWRVLSVDGDDAFLLADKNLDVHSYNYSESGNHSVTWEICTMRSWLNGYGAGENVESVDYSENCFLKNAFSEEERQAITTANVVNKDNPDYGTEGGNDTQDKVYLLSYEELTNPAYGFVSSTTEATRTRWAYNTAYTAAGGEIKGDMQDTDRYEYWWSRSPGKQSLNAVLVFADGKITDIYGVCYTTVAVRPVLHLNLAALPDSWSSAATETTKKAEATPTPSPSTSPAPVPTLSPWMKPEVTYDASEWETFAGRTKEEAQQKYTEAKCAAVGYEEMEAADFYEIQPSFQKPYHPGKLSGETLEAMNSLCNYYRWLAGEEDAEGDTSQDTDTDTEIETETEPDSDWNELQHQAFLYSYCSKEKPYDFPEDKWGRPDTSNYNFYWGVTPLVGIERAVNRQYTTWNSSICDSYKWREDILSPGNVRLRMGYSSSYLSMKLEQTDMGSKEKMPFTSFPAQGYMPNDMLSTDKTAWSVRVNQDTLTIPAEKDISIAIRHKESGATYVRSMADGNAYVNDESIFFEEPAEAGLSAYTGTYNVEITGLLDTATGKGAKICYSVTFFKAVDDLISEVKEVSLDGVTALVLPQEINVMENIEKLTAILPKQVTVTGKNGKKVNLPVAGEWRYDAGGTCWRNSVDAAKLPAGFADSAGVLSDFAIACEVGDNKGMNLDMTWDIVSDGADLTVGKKGEIHIWRNADSQIERAVVYQITKQKETYTAAVRYDTESSPGVEEDIASRTFVIPITYSLADTGDYVAVGYVKGEKTAYLSYTIVPISVAEKKETGGNEDDTGGSGTGETGTGGKPAGGNGGGTSSAGGKGNNAGGGNGKENNSKKDITNIKKQPEVNKKVIIPKVAKVRKYKVKAKKKGFLLTWKKDSKVSGYQVQVSAKKNFKGAKKISVKKSKTKYKISKLKAGKKYYIRIRAYRAYQTQDGRKKKAYGTWIIKKGKTKR